MKILPVLYFFLVCQTTVRGQATLNEVIDIAQRNSYVSQSSFNQLKIAQLNYVSFRVNYKPTLSFYGNAPVYDKDNFEVRQPDGSVKFLRRSQDNSNIGFSFTQPIAATGGSVSLNTDLYRFNDFVAKTQLYNGTPFFILLNQPLFSYNSLKWNKKIEPIKLQEAAKTQQVAMFQIGYDVCNLYFNIIDAQSNQQLATDNLKNNTINLAIEKRRVQLGSSTEDKLLQLEMQQLNSQQQLTTANLEVEAAFLLLRTSINSHDTNIAQLLLPERLPVLSLDKEKIIALAKQNLPMYLAFEREKMEAASNTAKAKTDGKQINLTASYGLNKAADNISSIYQNPNDQQRFSIGFSVPIADWGRKRNNLEIARLQEKETGIAAKKDEAVFLTEVTNLLNELPVLKKNISNALTLDTLGMRRYKIANRLYETGKTSLLELQAAQNEKDSSRRNYVAALRSFWEAWLLLKVKINTEL